MRPRFELFGGKLMLLVAATAVLASGCATAAGTSRYRVKIPEVRDNPTCYSQTLKRVVECQRGDDIIGVIWYDDYSAIVRSLKSACLANGQSKEECQAE